ncbi:acetyltransferase [Rubidibacter lacunae KORDI 51-2]|uniref:Acetyltransferase n=1 Tax=Rubidibacter lacunae KORDI 51-2 TaxID=582515 RepID=U5DKM3_9CHRO|nr:acetyltransferase [Rubidibacter lacunae KORDI 51-2]
MKLVPVVRAMQSSDANDAANVHALAFPRQTGSLEWMKCSLAAHPKCMVFVCEVDTEIVAYAIWTQKSGFRPYAVLELEQIAVLPERRRRGIATLLIRQSLELVKRELDRRGAKVKAITVSTRTDNSALRLYQRALGARHVATIANLYSADEAILVARTLGSPDRAEPDASSIVG